MLDAIRDRLVSLAAITHDAAGAERAAASASAGVGGGGGGGGGSGDRPMGVPQ
jgi:hypothetical protein